MYAQKLDLTDLHFDKRSYNKYRAYANAKRAQVILAELFAERYPDYHFASMHPGWVKTPGVKHSMRWFYYLIYPLLRTPEEGADTLHYLASIAKWEKGGAFWFDCKPVSPHMSAKTHSTRKEKEGLWTWCEKERKRWASHY
jgi:dehydrogenase/reductase SDR family member 12